MKEEWINGLQLWGSRNDSVREFWLFGSRATGKSGPDSDVDIALALMPPTGNHNWAFGNYVALHSTWKSELEAIVGRHVSLEAIEAGSASEITVRRAGVLLWSRD